MSYKELYELDQNDTINIEIIVERVTVKNIEGTPQKAFKKASEFMEAEAKNLHHTSSFKIEIIIL